MELAIYSGDGSKSNPKNDGKGKCNLSKTCSKEVAQAEAMSQFKYQLSRIIPCVTDEFSSRASVVG